MIRKSVLMFFLLAVFFKLPVFAQEAIDTGWISGKMLIKDGGPMSNGMVVFFRADEGPVPDPDRYLRIPDEVADMDAEGKFRIRLPVGSYYVGAIKRMSGEFIGPPKDGDYFFISQDRDGKALAYEIEKDKDLNIGAIAEAVLFKRVVAADATGISGVIRDIEGDPVGGAIVFAYFTETMTGLPPFTSYRTGEDGEYFISVSSGGTYYLRVRDKYGGGPPVQGAIMGGYGGEAPAPVKVENGKITKGIDITVIRHLERGPRSKNDAPGINKSIQQEQKKIQKQKSEKNTEK